MRDHHRRWHRRWQLSWVCLLPAAFVVVGSSACVVEVAGVAAPPPRTHFEENDPAVVYSGAWHDYAGDGMSGGVARLGMERRANVVFTFTGTGVSWNGYRDELSGIAAVYVDGKLVERVDTYASPARPASLVWSIDGLSDGTHRLTIEAEGEHNPRAGAAWIWIDGFDVRRGGAGRVALAARDLHSGS
jgi:hypothetical protein